MMVPEADQVNTSICPGVSIRTYLSQESMVTTDPNRKYKGHSYPFSTNAFWVPVRSRCLIANQFFLFRQTGNRKSDLYVVCNRPRFVPGLDCEPRKNRLGRGYRDQQDEQNPLKAIALSFYNSYSSQTVLGNQHLNENVSRSGQCTCWKYAYFIDETAHL